jgi:hypothetical protein
MKEKDMKPLTIPGELDLNELLESTQRVSWTAGTTVVGECHDDNHPSLAGRVLVRIIRGSSEQLERWMPTVQGLSVRTGDRVLVTTPANFYEPVVVGVLDGFTVRHKAEKRPAATVSLKPDESLRIESQSGKPLVEVYESSGGPVVRLIDQDADIEIEGALRISAKRLELVAREGTATIAAGGDVIVNGETIQLN